MKLHRRRDIYIPYLVLTEGWTEEEVALWLNMSFTSVRLSVERARMLKLKVSFEDVQAA